ncbi:TPA: hypothetical protein ACGOVA_001207 [Streptococcus suis]
MNKNKYKISDKKLNKALELLALKEMSNSVIAQEIGNRPAFGIVLNRIVKTKYRKKRCFINARTQSNTGTVFEPDYYIVTRSHLLMASFRQFSA